MTMIAHPALVLNADFRPMSYFPLSLLSWQDAVHAVFSERVAVVAEYDTWARSPSTRRLQCASTRANSGLRAAAALSSTSPSVLPSNGSSAVPAAARAAAQ